MVINTGVGPSYISEQAYLSTGNTADQLTDIEGYIATTDGTVLRTRGLTQPIPLRIGAHSLSMSFIVIGDLEAEDIILGRDFLKQHDILMDLTRNTFTIRNPQKSYTIGTIYTVDKSRGSHRGVIQKEQDISGGSMKANTIM